jgi:hypothetical protein
MARRLSTLDRSILGETYKAGGMLSTAELHETLDIPDLDAYIDDLRPYLQRVYIPGVPVHAGQPNGVALTIAGQDLMQAGLPPLLSERATKRLAKDVLAGRAVA